MSLWWQLAGPWLKKHWRFTLLALLLAFSTVLAGVGLLAVAGWFLTAAFIAGSLAVFNLFLPSAMVRGLSIWRIVSRYAERVVGHSVTLDVQAQIRTQTFAQLAQFKPAQLAQYKDGDLVARLLTDIERLDSLFLLFIAPLFTALTAGVLFSWLMGMALPIAGWLLLISLCLAAGVVPYVLAQRTARTGKLLQQQTAQLRAIAQDALAAHSDLLVFNTTAQAQQQFTQAAQQLAQAQQHVDKATHLGQMAQQLIMGGLVALLLYFGALAHQQLQLSAPLWVGLVLGAMGLFEVLLPLMRGAAGLGTVQAAAERIQQLQPSSSPTSGGSQAMPSHGELRIEAISLSYGLQPVLQNLSLCLKDGERISIEGLSGSGKSSLLMAIMQIQAIDQGAIYYGSVNLKEVQTAQLYQRFALLSQHSPLFMGSVRQNLLLAQPQATDEQLWQVLQQVRLAEHVQQIGGLDAWIGEGGNQLSTGQARRLCLARTVLSDAKVWLLDEPLAGLDTATAHAWLHDIQHLAQHRSVIIISHAPLPRGVVDSAYALVAGQLQLVQTNT